MRRLFGTAIAILLASCITASAQEQRGAIEGVIRDSSGAVLPGVTVEARTATGVVLTTTSDETGTFRFPSVLPGSYVVTANLDNFAPGKVDPVIVGLGQMKKVDFALAPRGVTESVQVVAESPACLPFAEGALGDAFLLPKTSGSPAENAAARNGALVAGH